VGKRDYNGGEGGGGRSFPEKRNSREKGQDEYSDPFPTGKLTYPAGKGNFGKKKTDFGEGKEGQ